MISMNWQFWLGAGISLALLLILLYQVDMGELWHSLQEADYGLLAPSIAIYFVAVLFRAVRWKYLLTPIAAIPVRRLYPVVVIGYMANNLLPVRLGEIVRSHYLARREDLSTSSALATVAVERVYDGITLLAFAAVSAPFLLLLGEFDGLAETSRSLGVVSIILTVSAFATLLVFFTLLGSSAAFAVRVEGWLNIVPPGPRPTVKRLYWTFVQGLSVLNSPSKHLGLFIYSLPVWFLEWAMYFLLAYSFGIDDYFSSVWKLLLVVLLLTATSNLATAIPSFVGGIGPFEAVAQRTLIAVGVGGEVALAYSGFLHLVALWLPVNVVGLVLLWRSNLSLRQMADTKAVTGPKTAPGLAGEAAAEDD